MVLTEIRSKSLLIRHRCVDSWFLSGYGMNVYRGCAHDCAYCDGRSEQYYVEGEFGADVAVKINAPELLDRELDPARRRKPLRRAYVALGGGVGDAYQPAEARCQLTRQVLAVLERRRWPVHVLTKSALVERDFDLLGAIRAHDRVIVSVSLSVADDKLAAIYEPGCPPPSRRLETLARAKAQGLAAGVFYMPVIPQVTDAPGQIDAVLQAARAAGADFILFGSMTLKSGRQQDHFLRVLAAHAPERAAEYAALYPGDRWGGAAPAYCAAVARRFSAAARRHGLPRRIPPRLYADILSENDRAAVMLSQLHDLLQMEGRPSPFARAGWAVSQLRAPVSSLLPNLDRIEGVGPAAAGVIREIVDTGDCAQLNALLGAG